MKHRCLYALMLILVALSSPSTTHAQLAEGATTIGQAPPSRHESCSQLRDDIKNTMRNSAWSEFQSCIGYGSAGFFEQAMCASLYGSAWLSAEAVADAAYAACMVVP